MPAAEFGIFELQAVRDRSSSLDPEFEYQLFTVLRAVDPEKPTTDKHQNESAL